MMFRLSLKTNASLVSLFLLSSAPMALSGDLLDDDSDSQEITKTPLPVTAVLNQQDLLKNIFEFLDPTDFSDLLTVNKFFYQIGAQVTYFAEGFPDRLKALFSSDDTPSDALLSFCESNITAVFPFLIKLPQSNHDSHFQKFRALFSKEDNKAKDYHGLLKHCSHYTDFISEKMKSWNRAYIIEALGTIKVLGIRDWIVEQAPKFFTEKMDGWERAQIIEALGDIPDLNIRNWIVAQAPTLFMEDMDGWNRAKIIEAFGDITDPEIREWIMEQAPKFFTEKMCGDQRAWIIEALGKITNPDIRDWILAQAPKLFTEEMDGFQKAKIIKALGDIPDPNIRDWIVAQAPKLFTEEMNGFENAKIIKALGKIADPNIRNEIVKQAPVLFTEDMDVEKRLF